MRIVEVLRDGSLKTLKEVRSEQEGLDFITNAVRYHLGEVKGSVERENIAHVTLVDEERKVEIKLVH